jgi:hypothetical protein
VINSRDKTLRLETIVGHGPGERGSADLAGELMLLSVDRGRYYNLNAVGARVWHLIASPRAIADVCRQLESEFDVSPERCQADVLELVSRLVGEGLAVVVRR